MLTCAAVTEWALPEFKSNKFSKFLPNKNLYVNLTFILYIYIYIYIYIGYRKDKAIPLQTWTGPEGSRRLWLPDFKTIGTWRCWGCHLNAPAAFNPQEIFLVHICVRGWFKLKAIMRPEGLRQWKVPMTSSEIEPVTFRLVAQYLNQLRHRVPLLYLIYVVFEQYLHYNHSYTFRHVRITRREFEKCTLLKVCIFYIIKIH